jgi:hypothetical protein
MPSHLIAAPGHYPRNHPIHPYFSRISFLADATPLTPNSVSKDFPVNGISGNKIESAT